MDIRARVLRVAVILGTRPEAIKLMPLLREFEGRSAEFECNVISTSQHVDLLVPLLRVFDIELDHHLGVPREGRSLDHLLGRTMMALDPVLDGIGQT